MHLPQDPNAEAPLRRSGGTGGTGKVRRLGAWQVAGDLPASFRYAAQGLAYGFSSQRNFRIHVFTGAITFSLGLWLQLPPGQLAVLVLTVAAVLVLELINTATEAVVELTPVGHGGLAMALFSQCFAVSALVAPLVTGVLLDSQRNGLALWLLTALGCATCLLLLPAISRRAHRA